jgi:hypothetical protein
MSNNLESIYFKSSGHLDTLFALESKQRNINVMSFFIIHCSYNKLIICFDTPRSLLLFEGTMNGVSGFPLRKQ